MEGHLRCKTPFLSSSGSSTAFSCKHKKATDKLSREGKATLHGKYLSSILAPPMEALAILWFSKYLIRMAMQCQNGVLDRPDIRVHMAEDSSWPVTPWSEKGSKLTYSDRDHTFFFSRRNTILAAGTSEKQKERKDRFMYFDFPELSSKDGPPDAHTTTTSQGPATNNSEATVAAPAAAVQPVGLIDASDDEAGGSSEATATSEED